MTRVKRGVMVRARHKKVLKKAKGFRQLRSKLFTQAKQALMKAGLSAYKGRKLKKRDFRTLWTARMSAALRNMGSKYSVFADKCFKKDIRINRKMCAELAAREPKIFEALAKKVLE